MIDVLTPTGLHCEYLTDPLGIDVARPRLSWTLESARRGARQSAYQVLVASTEEALLAGRGDRWDSGRVEGGQSAHSGYDGSPLTSGQRCWWAVRAWDGEGHASPYSAPARWEMGLLEAADWQGEWIGLDTADVRDAPMAATPAPGERRDDVPLAGLVPNPYLRTTLRLDGPVRRARLYATAKGLYELWLNGQRVGDALLTPGWTDYDRRIQYQTYDVTGMLRGGENVLGAILGTGWYAGYVGFGGRCRHYGTRPQLLLQGVIELDDGTTRTLASDGTWRATSGPIRHSDMLMGEHYDARDELDGWDRQGYDDARWQPAAAQARAATPRLVADRAEPVQITEWLEPVGIAEPASGVFIFDLGQNMVGWVRLQVRGEPGTRVQLRFAEILAPDGTIYTENLRTARQTDTYVLRGQGEEIFEPRFTFHGFRYVEVTGYPGRPTPEALSGRMIHSNTPAAGQFSCSSALVNQLQRNIEWGQRGNFLSIPTDCPQRDERLGWLGDAQIFVRTACANMDVAAFFTKWMVDVEDGQSPAGGFPDVAPRMADLADGSPAWGDAGVIVPWTLYQCYGDLGIVERHYPAMARWMDYLLQANPGLLRLGRLNNNFGDWLSIDADTPGDLLATAYWAYDAALMAAMARALGRLEDADRYRALCAGIKAAFLVAYVDAEGRVAGETQTGYVVALAMDLLPEGVRPAAARHLVAAIEARDWHLSTGFVGVGYLCPVLTRHGYPEVAYRLLLNETFPSWGYSIRHGATTIWERWDGYTDERGFQTPGMNSFNHYSLGSVGEWLYRFVAGIDVDAERPGYEHIVIRPYPGGGLTDARASYRSIRGTIVSGWRLEGDALILEITIPANAAATVALPTGTAAGITEGGVAATEAEGVRFVGIEGDRAVFAVGAGSYVFRVPAPIIVAGRG